MNKFSILASIIIALSTASCGGGSDNGQRFLLRITNVSNPNTLVTTSGTSSAVPLSPGVLVIHTAPAPFFANNTPDRGEGLEAIAEDGSPGQLIASLSPRVGSELEFATVFNTPVGASEPGPIFPGDSYEIKFNAQPGDNVNFATMFIPSNDLFFGPGARGIALFDNEGNPVSGDFTAQSPIWDAGTEENQALGTGSEQPMRQSGPNTGAEDSNNLVRLIPNPSSEGIANLPADSNIIQVTIEAL